MTNLFNIEQEYLELLKQIEELEGEITPELEDALSINRSNLESKIKAYYYFIKSKQGDISLIDDEITRLKALKESKENLISSLKERVNNALKLFGDTGKSGNQKLTFDTLTVYNVYHKPLLIQEDFNDASYFRYSLDYKFTKNQIEIIKNAFVEATGLEPESTSKVSIDKTELKQDLVAGAEIEGAIIDKTASYIVFK